MHKDGLKVHDADIGSYCTCMEMGGFSISVFRIDEELKNIMICHVSPHIMPREVM